MLITRESAACRLKSEGSSNWGVSCCQVWKMGLVRVSYHPSTCLQGASDCRRDHDQHLQKGDGSSVSVASMSKGPLHHYVQKSVGKRHDTRSRCTSTMYVSNLNTLKPYAWNANCLLSGSAMCMNVVRALVFCSVHDYYCCP